MRKNTSTSAATDSDQRTLARAGLTPAARQGITAKASCMAWLPRMSAATSTSRRNRGSRSNRRTPPAGARTASVARACRSSGTTSAATAAVPRSRACNATITSSPQALTACPDSKVPPMKAAEPVPRTQPYSNPRRPLPGGGAAAPSAKASARMVTGASAAACIRLSARNDQNPWAGR